MTSKLRNVFLHVSRANKTRCISLKLFKHLSEPVVKIEAYHPYRQYVVIILSIFMMMRLLWLPFNDRYRKIMCIIGLKQGQITPNIENKYVLKVIHLVARCSKITNTVLFVKRILHHFSAFCCFLLVMSECPKVHFVALRFNYLFNKVFVFFCDFKISAQKCI